jgi:hypothetical protein
MFKINHTYKVKMLYNDGNTEVVKDALFLSGAEYITEQYTENKNVDYKYYWIYLEIQVKFFGITVAKRKIRLKEWGQYDEV